MKISVISSPDFNDSLIWNKIVEAHIVPERDSLICLPCPFIEQWAKDNRMPVTTLGLSGTRTVRMLIKPPIHKVVDLGFRGDLVIVIQSPLLFPGTKVLMALARYQPNYLLIRGSSAYTVRLGADGTIEEKKLWTARKRGKRGPYKKKLQTQEESSSSKLEGGASTELTECQTLN